MKKFLLVLTLVSITCSSALAAGQLLKKDPNGYETVNGISMRNLWLLDRFHYGVNELQTDFEWCNTKARTAVLQDGIVFFLADNEQYHITSLLDQPTEHTHQHQLVLGLRDTTRM